PPRRSVYLFGRIFYGEPVSTSPENAPLQPPAGEQGVRLSPNWWGPGGFSAEPPFMHQPACKPGSVRRRGKPPRATPIPLRRRLPGASSNLPGRPDPDTGPKAFASRRPYSVLLPVGFAVPLRLPATRCALTAPFHPCRGRSRGGSFSVALSLRSRRLRGDVSPDVIRHRMSMEPGLSSPATFRSLPE